MPERRETILLNVGPTSEGLIPEASVQRLKEIGDERPE